MGERRTYKDAFPDMNEGIFHYLGVPPWQMLNRDELAYIREQEEMKRVQPGPVLEATKSARRISSIDSGTIGEAFHDFYLYNEPELKASLEALDRWFYIEYGDRLQGAILRQFDTGAGVTVFGAVRIGEMVTSRYLISWKRLWASVTAYYNPVENYNANEVEYTTTDGNESEDTSRNGTDTFRRTNNLTDGVSKTRDLTDAHSGSDTVSGTNSEAGTSDRQTGANGTEKVFGYNSTEGKNRANQNTTGTETIGTTNSQNVTSETEYGQNIRYTGTESETVTHSGTVNDTRTGNEYGYNNRSTNMQVTRRLIRSGNIGVTTSAQMIAGEIKLWQWSYFKQVLEDVANFLTLPIFV